MQAKLGGLSSRRRYDDVAALVTSTGIRAAGRVEPVGVTDASFHGGVHGQAFVVELFEQSNHDEVARARVQGGLDDIGRFPDARGRPQRTYFHRILANGSTMHDCNSNLGRCAWIDSYALTMKMTSRVRLWAVPVRPGLRRWQVS